MIDSNELELGVSDAEIMATFDPFVQQRFPPTSFEWQDEARATSRRFSRARFWHRLLGWMPALRRTQDTVKKCYSQQWASRAIEDQLSVKGPAVACEWRDLKMHARAVATKRVHLLFLAKVIERLAPRTVLEVGSGNGLNLFVLAGQFADVRFTGIELTSGGIDAAARVWRMPRLPAAVREFSPKPLLDEIPGSRITLVRGNAASLPFEGSSFDLVFTALALEQMEQVRHDALGELRRVSGSHVAMVEPFREWNDEGCPRDYIVANDYFSGRISDLPGYGLHPILTTADMPAKLTNKPGLIVCRCS